MHTLLENVGHEVENIDFIYFERAFSNEVRLQKGESKELYWFTKEEIDIARRGNCFFEAKGSR